MFHGVVNAAIKTLYLLGQIRGESSCCRGSGYECGCVSGPIGFRDAGVLLGVNLKILWYIFEGNGRYIGVRCSFEVRWRV